MNLSWKLFNAFGIPVRLHFSMIVIPFIAFSWVPGSGVGSLIAATVLAIMLFGSVLAHELGHALTGRRFGVHTEDIILTPIGGMARMLNIPTSPRQEIAISIAGPLVSLAIALGSFILLATPFVTPILPAVAVWALNQLFVLNLILAVFNLIPAIPMDGGRVFRGLLALKYGHFKATRIASRTGKILAIAGGFYGFYTGWWSLGLISVFIYFSAGQEERMAYMREAARQGSSGFPGFGFGGFRPPPPGRPPAAWEEPHTNDWSGPEHKDNGPTIKIVEGGKVEVISRKTPNK